MKKEHKPFLDIFLRYVFLFAIGIPNLWIFYFIFTPLTVYPVYLLFKMLYPTVLAGNVIILNGSVPIELVKSCIAGSAYYLILILNFSTPKINFQKRMFILISGFLVLLFFNVVRIFLLGMIFLNGFSWFVITHEFFWYFMSTIFVAGIWFSEVYFFRIKEIPFYSDIKLLYKHSR